MDHPYLQGLVEGSRGGAGEKTAVVHDVAHARLRRGGAEDLQLGSLGHVGGAQGQRGGGAETDDGGGEPVVFFVLCFFWVRVRGGGWEQGR